MTDDPTSTPASCIRRARRAIAGRTVAVAVVATALLLVLAGPRGISQARAAGPPMLLGFVDDAAFEWDTAATRDEYLGRAQSEGGSVIRLEVFWSSIAPAVRRPGFRAADPGDPQYDFATVDAAVRAATAHHQQVLLLVRDAPVWAERADIPAHYAYRGSWWPNAAMFGQFAHAVAARYSGRFEAGGAALPAVHFFQAWNEPNLPLYLSPQWGTSHGKVVPLAPGIYRDLLNAFYRGVKDVSRADTVLSAGTAPYGDPPATGQQRMRPVTFLEDLFCLGADLRRSACADPPHLDALDHHPYSLSPAHAASNAADISVVDLAKITRVVAAARRAGTVVPRTAKPIWVSEIAWSDVKPYSLATQARALSEAFYLLWRQGVAVTLWFQVRDQPHQSNSFKGSGLYTLDGVAKPVAAAYRFPFCAFPGARGIDAVWGKAPGAGRVAVQLLRGRRWQTILAVSAGAGGYFRAARRLAPGMHLRAVQGRSVSPVWDTTGGL